MDFKSKSNKKILQILLFILPFLPILLFTFRDLYLDYVVKGGSPRELLTFTGIKIALDYFPLGSGPGTFGGWISRTVYSPLFYECNLHIIWGLSPQSRSLINDTFWPHILAEPGFLGAFVYVSIIIKLIKTCKRGVMILQDQTLRIFALGTFMLVFASLIESTKATLYEDTCCVYFWFGSIGVLWSLIKYSMIVPTYDLPP